jgi:hypothetical protein
MQRRSARAVCVLPGLFRRSTPLRSVLKFGV